MKNIKKAIGPKKVGNISKSEMGPGGKGLKVEGHGEKALDQLTKRKSTRAGS